MSTINYRGYTIQESTGHGKNVAGNKKTSTVRVIVQAGENGYQILKQASYKVGDGRSYESAIQKCKNFIDSLETHRTNPKIG